MFFIEDAKKYGLDAAVFLYNLYFWLAKNKANNKHQHDGHTWTYNSQRALERLFPYWTRRRIRTVVKNLLEANVIKVGNYNKTPYDRTTWYALGDETILEEFDNKGGQKRPMEVTEMTNGSARSDQPIPDIKPDIKPDTLSSKHDCPSEGLKKEKTNGIQKDIIAYLNEKTGKLFRATSKSTLKHINARLKEGFTLTDFKRVIDFKASEWLGDERWRQYLRPETLFAGHFEGYLQASPQARKKLSDMTAEEKQAAGFTVGGKRYFTPREGA